MIEISQGELERVYAQAAAEYPAECCGILTRGPEGGVAQVHPCTNIQDQLHAQDPEQYPREARIAYFIDPKQLYQIVSTAEKAGGEVVGFYHSHIDCDAYFSDEDKERAMAWDEPAYPNAVYLVLAVYQGEVKGYECFAWNQEQRDFLPAQMQVVS